MSNLMCSSSENEKQKQLKIIESGENYFCILRYDNIRNLEGKVLTLIDASIGDVKQREAVKSIFRQTLWFNWAYNLELKNWSCEDSPVGMPDSY